MSEITFSQAQANMREGYYCGAPGVLVSGLVWLIAGLVAASVPGSAAVAALLIGGAMIHPLGVLATRMLGRRGAHAAGNPLGRTPLRTHVIAFCKATRHDEVILPADGSRLLPRP